MSDWNEDNFLEEIMPLLSTKPSTDSCPDAETICSVIDGEASHALGEAVTAHAARCPLCAQFEQRLRSFDRAIPLRDESEWREAGKRLDNWVEVFLASSATVAGEAVAERTPRFNRWWKHITNPLRSVGFQLALGATAALVLVASVYLLTRIITQSPVEIATRTSASREQPADVASAQGPVKKDDSASGTLEERVQAPVQPKKLSSVTGSVTSKRPAGPREQVTIPSVVTPPVEERRAAPTGGAVTPPPPNPAGTPEMPALAKSEAPSLGGAAIAQGPLSPSSQGKGPIQTASSISSRPTTGEVNVGVVARGGGGGITGNARSRSTGGGGIAGDNPAANPDGIRSLSVTRSTAPPAQPLARANAVRPRQTSAAPALVQIDSGTRVWISVSSVTVGAGGDFEFRGTVLLPVEQANTILLDRGTGVYGVGKKNNGRTSLRIIELTILETPYGLKDESKAMNAQAPGVGGAVEFSAGKVFEMWMAARAVYVPK